MSPVRLHPKEGEELWWRQVQSAGWLGHHSDVGSHPCPLPTGSRAWQRDFSAGIILPNDNGNNDL